MRIESSRMILNTLKLRDFRAHTSTDVSLASKINLIDGPNGAGKTNILEAVHYLCLSKSFLSANDRNVLRQGAEFFELEGAFESRTGRKQVVRVAYMPSGGKRLFINGAALERQVDIVGRLPVVVMEPGVSKLTMGGPEHRRRFLNNILSQARPMYMDDLIRYRRALRQRNELLGRYRGAQPDASVLDPITGILIDAGTRVIAGRLKFLRELRPFLEQAFAHLGLDRLKPSIEYAGLVSSSADELADEPIQDAFYRALRRGGEREQSNGRTCAGPHRDELLLMLNEQGIRRFASTGQHRAFGIALKLAQYLYLQYQMDESPILLLDDIFDSLDEARTEAIMGLLQANATGQSLITTTNATKYLGQITAGDAKHLAVDSGKVREHPLVP